MGKCIVVEGRADKMRLIPLLAEEVTILCTNGTISEVNLIELLEDYEHYEIVTMFDADKNGEKLRKLMNRAYPEVKQLIIPQEYVEVEKTPTIILRNLLIQAKFSIKEG
ncbi:MULTISPECIES: toprim domain-containing protein [Solibacillus]|uniref:Toprim domain-containing protein n=1 Tax=Solibacillus merdavium TaxID=2762218 RepID=A0ABR8XMU6_9BACL|nr:toprim domain-containing protein [Solibacillus merdavium]MBD8033254.1 toprim domain-containing protein [Solibacillus merdavium]